MTMLEQATAKRRPVGQLLADTLRRLEREDQELRAQEASTSRTSPGTLTDAKRKLLAARRSDITAKTLRVCNIVDQLQESTP